MGAPILESFNVLSIVEGLSCQGIARKLSFYRFRKGNSVAKSFLLKVSSLFYFSSLLHRHISSYAKPFADGISSSTVVALVKPNSIWEANQQKSEMVCFIPHSFHSMADENELDCPSKDGC